MPELILLTVPDCPNEPILRERLDQASTGFAGITLAHHVIDSEVDAARWGMHGSPTLLINGVDPFAAPGTSASVSCRLYRDERGLADTAPSVVALRQALQRAVDNSVRPEFAQAVDRAGLGRLAPVDGGQRAVQQVVLRAFAATGRPPTVSELDQAAAPYGSTGAEVMAQLHAADFLRIDTSGKVVAAYPFSPTPTPHRVRILGGQQVFAMCAIDALGIAAMLGRDVTITSADPQTAETISVRVPAEGDATSVVWDPATAVVFYGRQGDCGADTASMLPVPLTSPPAMMSPGLSSAAQVCCGYINFFTSHDTAMAWATQHPHITGQVLDRHTAWEIGARTFGPLLTLG